MTVPTLALLPAREVIAAEHAWLSPLPPEGASAIVHGDVSHAAEMAELQQVGVLDLAARGIVSHIVPEPADDTAASLALAVVAECAAALRRQTHGQAHGQAHVLAS
jgi:acetyl-CoA carboxylase carboxyl transferase subunit beta